MRYPCQRMQRAVVTAGPDGKRYEPLRLNNLCVQARHWANILHLEDRNHVCNG